jgi:hypothetical protein
LRRSISVGGKNSERRSGLRYHVPGSTVRAMYQGSKHLRRVMLNGGLSSGLSGANDLVSVAGPDAGGSLLSR